MDKYQRAIQAAWVLLEELGALLDDDHLDVEAILKDLMEKAIKAIDTDSRESAVKNMVTFIRSYPKLEARFDDLIGGNWMGASAKFDARGYDETEVLYATDRKASGQQAPESFYLGEPALNSEISWGRCVVTIPRSHQIGELETPNLITRRLWGTDQSKYVVLTRVEPLEATDFDSAAHNQLSISAEALIFVHGYNVTFAEAVRRTAQLCQDLEQINESRWKLGLRLCFSWPSRGFYSAYEKDKDLTEFSARHLAEVLRRIQLLKPNLRIHLIAHSMGNLVMTSALGRLFDGRERLRFKIQEVVLAAPDVSPALFNALAEAVCSSAQRVTLYASSNDRALWLSKLMHFGPRAGDSSNEMFSRDGIDGIDASRVDSSLLSIGHGYFAKPSVLKDLANLALGMGPGERGLQLASSGKYWLI